VFVGWVWKDLGKSITQPTKKLLGLVGLAFCTFDVKPNPTQIHF